MSRITLVLALAVSIAGCRTTPVVDTAALPAPSAEPAPRPQQGGALPSNSEVILRLTTPLSRENRVGDIVTAVVEEAVTAQNNEVILAAGTLVTGLVTGVDGSDHAGDAAAVRLNFVRITVDSANHPFSARILATRMDTQADTARTSLGSVISAEERETILGNSMGVGAGSIISLGTGGPGVLPAGTRLVVRTRDRLELINRE